MNSGRVEVAFAIAEPAVVVSIDGLFSRIAYQHPTRRKSATRISNLIDAWRCG